MGMGRACTVPTYIYHVKSQAVQSIVTCNEIFLVSNIFLWLKLKVIIEVLSFSKQSLSPLLYNIVSFFNLNINIRYEFVNRKVHDR